MRPANSPGVISKPRVSRIRRPTATRSTVMFRPSTSPLTPFQNPLRGTGPTGWQQPRRRRPKPFLGNLASLNDLGTQERSTATKLSLPRVQLIECALQLFQLLPGFTEFALRCQALVVGKVFGGFRDERVAILCGLGRRGG